MKFKELQPLGEQLDGGIFAGLTTKKNGTHCAVVLLPGKSRSLYWNEAKAWATEQGGELPSRPVAALLFANVKDLLHKGWHWIADEGGATYAWDYNFDKGNQSDGYKSYKGSAVAVRLIPLEDLHDRHQTAAEAARVKKIASLKRQIAVLEKLAFTIKESE